jgi:hypothetical protein
MAFLIVLPILVGGKYGLQPGEADIIQLSAPGLILLCLEAPAMFSKFISSFVTDARVIEDFITSYARYLFSDE